MHVGPTLGILRDTGGKRSPYSEKQLERRKILRWVTTQPARQGMGVWEKRRLGLHLRISCFFVVTGGASVEYVVMKPPGRGAVLQNYTLLHAFLK